MHIFIPIKRLINRESFMKIFAKCINCPFQKSRNLISDAKAELVKRTNHNNPSMFTFHANG